MNTLRLHHVTSRRHCASIAEYGFRDGERMATGVYLSPPGLMWVAGGFDELDFALLDDDIVVYAFDVPEDVAGQFAVRERVPSADDPGDEVPECFDDDDPANYAGEGWTVYEYCVPAEVANRYCVGLVHWSGAHPLGRE